MDIQHLTYFSALCETMNYTTAARRCFISRQAMRQAIQAMESEYGLPLVENTRNHLSLTSAGQLLYEKSRLVLQSFQDMNTAMHSCITQEKPLRIGICRSLVPFYAPEIVRRTELFAQEYSGLKLNTCLLNSDEILEALEREELDGGIIIDLGELPLPYSRTVLRQDTMTLFLSSNHPLAAKKELMLEDLRDQEILLMSQPELCFRPFYDALGSRQISVKFHVVPDYYEAGYRILQTGALALDRFDGELPRRNHLDCNLPLEKGAFTLCCSLLIRDEYNRGAEFLKKYLLALEYSRPNMQ